MREPFPYHEQPEGLRLSPSLGLDDDQEARLRDYAWQTIVTGQLDAEDFCRRAKDRTDLENLDDGVLTEAFGVLLAARHAQQQAWPQEVRETALTRAFAELETIGIIARDNFSCCHGCASGWIAEEYDDSRPWRGYVYFNEQEAAWIPETRETYLSYGPRPDPEAWGMTEDQWDPSNDKEWDKTYDRLAATIAREAVPVLERHGITVECDGESILLKDLDWYAEVTAEDLHGQP